MFIVPHVCLVCQDDLWYNLAIKKILTNFVICAYMLLRVGNVGVCGDLQGIINMHSDTTSSVRPDSAEQAARGGYRWNWMGLRTSDYLHLKAE